MLNKTMVLLQTANNETLLNAINEGVSEKPDTFSSSNNVLELLGLVFLLVFILVATYFTTRFIGKFKKDQMKTSNFQVIDTYRVNQNKLLQIVKVANKYIVIAISKDQITFITELDESQVYQGEVTNDEQLNFKQILNQLRNKK